MARKVLVLGSTSRAGGHFIDHPPKGWEVESAGRTDPRPLGHRVASHVPLDLSDERAVRTHLRSTSAEAWVNFAARTDVDGCEKERPQDPAFPRSSDAPGSAWRINAELPRWLAEEAERAGRFLVHFSTDYVFDGARGPYAETTPPSPFSERIGWYGYTKGVGEAAVFASNGPRAIVRIAHPYGSCVAGRMDLPLTLLAKRREGRLFPLYTDQRITPTWVPDISEALAPILERATERIYHLASPEVTSPYEFARALFGRLGWSVEGLPATTLASHPPTPGHASRPLAGGLKVSEIHRLDVRPLSFREGIRRWADLREGLPGSIYAPQWPPEHATSSPT